MSFPFFPVLELAEKHRHLARFAADLWNVMVWEHLARHPILSLIDLDDGGQTNMAGAGDPEDEQAATSKVIDFAFLQDRRDEIGWFELGLDPAAASYVTLKIRDRQGNLQEFKAAGPNLISGLLEQVLAEWLTARQLPPAPRPMPPLFVTEFWEAVRAVEQVADCIETGNQAGISEIGAQLKYVPIAVMRLCLTHMGDHCDVFEQRILELEPDNPVSLRSEFFRLLGEQGEKLDRTLMRKVIEGAPGWGKPHLSMFGEHVPADQGLCHQSLAALCMPSNPYALDNYGNHLMDAYRHEEAYRYFDRSTRMSPLFQKSYQNCMRASKAIGRPGEALQDAVARFRFYPAWQQSGHQVTPEMMRTSAYAQLKLAWAYRDVGRLDEAIELYRQALPDLMHDESIQVVFKVWTDDPEVLASAFAREGHHRRDPARVLTGFSRGTVDTSADVAMLIHALIAVGKEDLAALCFAHWHGADIIGGGVARLAGARAFLLTGDLPRAVEQLQIVQLRMPQSRWETELDRLWRLAAARPAADWEREVQRRLDAGALRLAMLLARDVADFVPGLAESAVVRRALFGDTPPASTPYSEAWLESLRGAVGPDTSVPVDDFFHKFDPAGGLAAADTLVGEWPVLLGEGAPNPEDPATGATTLYVLAQALCRYFAATTQAPSVMAGAYRQVADEALTLAARASIADGWLRPLFEAIEQAGAAVDYWVFDSWLLRLERAFSCDDNTGGHPDALTQGLRRIATFFRGDERIGFELGNAMELRKDAATHHQARFLYERMVRAVGTGTPAVAWSEVADACLPADKALDVHWTAAIANPAHAVPWTNLAKRSFELGKPAQAVEALIAAFPPTSKPWRMAQLDGLRPLWEAANLSTPFDFQAAATMGVAALQAGQTPVALACLRWCDAVDPNNKGVLNNLGIAHARAGDVYETVRTFVKIDKAEGLFTAGQALVGAQKYSEAVRVHRYGSLFWKSGDKWLVLGGTAWFAEDDETAAEAYEMAFQQKQGRLSVSELNLFAGSLCGAGQLQRAAEVAELVIQAAGSDPTFYSGGMHSMARALLGQDRADEAVPYAEQAVKVNPLPDNAKEFEETLRRAMRNDPPPRKGTRAEQRKFAAWHKLEQGDPAGALGIAAPSLAMNATDFPLWRVKLCCAELRGRDHDEIANPAGLETASDVLAATAGATDPEASLVRVLALAVREKALFPVDPVVPLGAPLPFNELEPQMRERRALSVPKPAPEPAATPAYDPAAQARASQVAQAAVQAAAGAEADPVVFPGQKIAKLSDYVGLVKAMQGNDPLGALARAGLDMASYGPIAMQWSQKLAADPTLTARFTQLMRAPA